MLGERSKGVLWECVDSENEVESCESLPLRHDYMADSLPGGGCVHPDDPYAPIGEDCTAIPNTDRMRCIEGKCTIFSCRKGWKLHGIGWNASCIAVNNAYGVRRRRNKSPFVLNVKYF